GIVDTTMSLLLSIFSPGLTREPRLLVQARISIPARWHGAHGYYYAISRIIYLSWRGSGGRLGEEIKLIGAPDRLSPRARVQLGQHGGNMVFDRPGARREPFGDLGVA